ncbi:FAD-dependent monooxygenase [Lentzea flaviverrucosa]|uniref:2-polyprenyl-6-methoxyphenol hydroxylase n=1 Tax=Lentzea flaviverrucosa TaxID=200379 RepID=A0A1H9C4N1_9PSEU|nr:FAD-dependent monooxygenase [Lentzea flaviverrucosa]RDI24445.1 2-polyprenyl-6-methoxyphenol hydroxylase-like FAD-dependent oxidoreductase [Lentzea flaviverrucosa]SEP95931.1 2-polyprenyl-6-methoxyphenol hydroxylase [Lentzea flaviverrucosa]
MHDAVIVGAGPTGLWLAGELRLGGASVVVLETRPRRDENSKALTIHPRTIEILDCRGVAEPFLAEGIRIPNGHFGGLPDRMDFSVLDTPYPFTLALPQARTEELLEQRAAGMGAAVRRSCRVVGLSPRGVELADGEIVAGRFVVGCDGTRSVVREAAGIDFPGTDATTWGWLGDVVLDAPPERGFASVTGPDGGLMVVPLPGGVHRIVGGDPATDRPEWPGELTLDELRATVEAIAGTDFGMRDPKWLSRFGNATRQAAAYRSGHVLLAGDAAHMHFPTGGVGMNVGIQDAHNLGWKLAAVVTGRADDALLDTYHSERHPVGADLLRHTRAQTALITAYSAEGQALRAVVSELIASAPDMSGVLAERLSGLDVAYATGRRVREQDLPDGDTLFARLRTGEHVRTEAGLVRPDGHLAQLPPRGSPLTANTAQSSNSSRLSRRKPRVVRG